MYSWYGETVVCSHVNLRLSFAVRAWSHRIVWLHAICTTEDIFACLSSLRALPMAEEYYWRSSLILQVYISPL